jgi:arylsulfatase
VTLRYDFTYDGNGRGRGGLGTLSVNGRKVAEGRIDRTIPNVFSPDEGASVGVDDETVVTDDYKERDNRFTGTLGRIVVELK